MGDPLWAQIREKQVLEVGCGAGRFTEVLLNRGAHVTSVDLSLAVEANTRNFPPNERHRVAQADVRTLPFRAGSYDIVFCLGVIQHTPDPEATITALWRQVRPGGWLVIDHYSRPIAWYTRTAAPLRAVMIHLSPETTLKVTRWLVRMLLPLHRQLATTQRRYHIISRISPLVTYYHALSLSLEAHAEWAELDTHDSLTDHYKHFRSVDEVRRHLQNIGGIEIWVEKGGNGVEARARKPAV